MGQWKDGMKERKKDKQGWMDEEKNGRIQRWTQGWLKDGQKDGRRKGQMNR